MKQIKYFCDMCNKEVQRNKLHHIRTIIETDYMDKPSNIDIDMCKKCYASFYQSILQKGSATSKLVVIHNDRY